MAKRDIIKQEILLTILAGNSIHTYPGISLIYYNGTCFCIDMFWIGRYNKNISQLLLSSPGPRFHVLLISLDFLLRYLRFMSFLVLLSPKKVTLEYYNLMAVGTSVQQWVFLKALDPDHLPNNATL